MEIWQGRRLGNYRALQLLGCSNREEFYLGVHIYSGTLAALKVFSTQIDRELQQTFLIKIRRLVTIAKPHILPIFEFFLKSHVSYVVVECVTRRRFALRCDRFSHSLPVVELVVLISPPISNLSSDTQPSPSKKRMPPQCERIGKPLTSLVGREREVDEIQALLLCEKVRLVTLTGPGGVGKTHLALEVASKLKEHFSAGAKEVMLAQITEAELVFPTIACVLGMCDPHGEALLERLCIFLLGKELLLVIDNLEQVLVIAPRLVDLLIACPGLKLLVTSRVLLHVRGEYEYIVKPLALPDVQALPPLEQLCEIAAVALFTQRVQAMCADFQLIEENAPLVAEICVRLDGLPLALELAATRIKLLTLPALLRHLEKRLQILTGGGQDLPARQQTLRATFQWSYALLSQQERQLFRWLAAFVDSFSIEAALSLCTPIGTSSQIIDALDRLLNSSMLMTLEPDPSERRLTMLTTLREYALQCLIEEGELELVQKRHAEHYLSLVEQAESSLFDSEQMLSPHSLEPERVNIREAVQWLVAQRRRQEALRLTSALGLFWFLGGYLTTREYLREGRKLLEQALALSDGEIPVWIQAKAMTSYGIFIGLLGDPERAEQLCLDGQPIYRSMRDQGGIVRTLWMLIQIALMRNEYILARQRGEEALLLARQLEPRNFLVLSLLSAGQVNYYLGAYEQAYTLLQESFQIASAIDATLILAAIPYHLATALLALGRQEEALRQCREGQKLLRQMTPCRRSLAWVTSLRGAILLQQGMLAEAKMVLEEARTLHSIEGNQRGLNWTTLLLARVLLALHESTQALALCEDRLSLIKLERNSWYLSLFLDELGRTIAGAGDLSWAVQLWSAAEALRISTHILMPPFERTTLQSLSASIRGKLGETAFGSLWKAGQRLTPQQALELGEMALLPTADVPSLFVETEELSPLPEELHGGAEARLTRRERDVLRLVAEGRTNACIAEQLIISRVTVNSYLRTIYDKLGVCSRTAATRYAIDHKLL